MIRQFTYCLELRQFTYCLELRQFEWTLPDCLATLFFFTHPL